MDIDVSVTLDEVQVFAIHGGIQVLCIALGVGNEVITGIGKEEANVKHGTTFKQVRG